MVRLIIGQEEQDEKWWSIKLIIKIVWFILKIDRYKKNILILILFL